MASRVGEASSHPLAASCLPLAASAAVAVFGSLAAVAAEVFLVAVVVRPSGAPDLASGEAVPVAADASDRAADSRCSNCSN